MLITDIYYILIFSPYILNFSQDAVLSYKQGKLREDKPPGHPI